MGGALGSVPWIVPEIELVDGIEYVKLTKLDTGFERFVLGGYRQGQNSMKDVTWLDTLRVLRNKAQLPKKDTNPMFADMKVRRTPVKQVVSTTFVELQLPPLQTHEAVQFRVLTTSNPRACASVELRSDVLSYIRAAIIEHGKCETPTKRERPSVQGERRLCRWYNMRRKDDEPQGGFQAFRAAKDSGRKTRFFPCTSDDPDLIDAVKDQAVRWAKGCDADAPEDPGNASPEDGSDDDGPTDGGELDEPHTPQATTVQPTAAQPTAAADGQSAPMTPVARGGSSSSSRPGSVLALLMQVTR